MGVTPSRGVIGAHVVVDGTNLAGATGVTFGGVTADPATVRNIDNLHVAAVVPAGALTGPVGVTTAAGSLPTTARFVVVPPPTIAGFKPANAPAGASITITGTGLDTALDVAFNGVSTTFSVLSDASIRAVVPPGATAGLLTVTTVGGVTTSTASFTVDPAAPPPPSPPPPSVSSLAPNSGAVGSLVTITGSGFTGAKTVSLNGTASTFTVSSDTSISATVPSGATSGAITVTTAAGAATSAATFTVV
jgi:hypothetical protein